MWRHQRVRAPLGYRQGSPQRRIDRARWALRIREWPIPDRWVSHRKSAIAGEPLLATRAGALPQWLFDSQGAEHAGRLVAGHVAVVLILARGGIDHRLLGGSRRDIDVDTKFINGEVVQR